MRKRDRKVIDDFHDLYYNGLDAEGYIFARTYWMGVQCLKCPLDLWMYQEIIAELRPDLIVETGTHMGGSALFMAHMLDAAENGEIISIDIQKSDARPIHPRITYVTGSSADPRLIRSLLGRRPAEKRLVVLDSDHSKAHVLKELQLLAPYVTLGSYLIVEDTNINGHPTFPNFGEGPHEAVAEFLKTNREFEADCSRERFLLTFNPGGYLRRIRATRKRRKR